MPLPLDSYRGVQATQVASRGADPLVRVGADVKSFLLSLDKKYRVTSPLDDSLTCVKYRLCCKTQYIRHLRDGDSCGLPEVREVQIML